MTTLTTMMRLSVLLLLPRRHRALLTGGAPYSRRRGPPSPTAASASRSTFASPLPPPVGVDGRAPGCSGVALRRGAVPPNLLGPRRRGHLSHRRPRATPLHSSTSDAVDRDEDRGSSSEVSLPLAAAVGVVTSVIGYLYSKCLSAGFHFLWRTLPEALFDGNLSGFGPCRLLHRYPAAYIVMVMTLGGGIVAALSTFQFPKLFNAHDYVHVLSREDGRESDIDRFPSAREQILPVMLLSLLTSISGFSLGPEAPMVAAGGLAGVSVARRYLRSTSKGEGNKSNRSSSIEETLAYAGAAGTLTGTMKIPLAGPIFALECVGRGAGVSSRAARSWSAAMAASLAGLALIRGGLMPDVGAGGRFAYGARAAVGAATGRETVLTGVGCGVGGALVGTCFHKAVAFLKSALWPKKSSSNREEKKSAVVLKKIAVATALGLLSVLYPQTMFWGEGSLQCAADGQCTPLSATHHGIPSMMTQLARVNPDRPFASGAAAAQVSMAKFAAIALASAGGFPGGVIFPLLSNGANFAHALLSASRPLLPAASSSLVAPMAVMSFMAATLTSVTRTPLASVLILALAASGTTPLSVLLPGALMASYVSVWVSDLLSSNSFFEYAD
ncbi:hypothetical protein ACHAWF_008180 [Thalassiosira exigua]